AAPGVDRGAGTSLLPPSPHPARDPVTAAWSALIAAWRCRQRCPPGSCCVFLGFVLVKLSDCADCSSVWPGRDTDRTGARERGWPLPGCAPVKKIAAVTGGKRPAPI